MKERSATLVKYKNSDQFAIKIIFPFNHKDLERVRTLSERHYHPDDIIKFWSCPLTIDSVEKLSSWNFDLDPKLEDFLANSKLHVNNLTAIEIPELGGVLREFQKKGVAFVDARDGNALIGDDMGLGKTIQTLAWLQLRPEKRPVIVTCPATVKIPWEREANIWLKNPETQIIEGRSTYNLYGKIIIINYDILKYWVEPLRNLEAKVLVLDEIQKIKNNKAIRTKAIKKLKKGIPHVIGLSGTPIENRPAEFYNAIKLIDSTVVTNFWDFAERYCDLKSTDYGWDYSGATNTEELHEKLTNTIMIRRKKSEVMKELPEKTYSFVPIQLDNRERYEFAEKFFLKFIKEEKGAEAARRANNARVLTEIEGLKQLAVRGKLKEATNWIEDFLESGNKLVVFAIHKFVIDHLTSHFESIAVKVDGSVSGKKRQEAIDKFQIEDKITLFIGNIKAAGIGINLTASSAVAFLELPWTPGELVQAEDRVHRIGQKDGVNVYYLLANNSIEEEIARLLDHKKKVLDMVLNGKKTKEESLLTELINNLNLVL